MIKMGISMSPARKSFITYQLKLQRLTLRLHKRNFRLDNGDCTNDDQFKVLAFDAREENDQVFVLLPPPDDLDAMIGSKKCELAKR
jgi:hypothetical protein